MRKLTDTPSYYLKFIRNLLLIIVFVMILFLIHQLSTLLLPLILALLVVMFLFPVIESLQKIKIPRWVILPVLAILFFGILFAITLIIINTGREIFQNQDYFVERFLKRVDNTLYLINSQTDLSLDRKQVLDYLKETLNRAAITNLARDAAVEVGHFSSSLLIFTIYFIFLLMGISNYKRYLHFVGGDRTDLVESVEMIQRTLSTYIVIKTIISLVTAVAATLICVFFGIKFALFWGFVTFILNFIPTIGSIIATFPPVIMAFIQYDSLYPTLFIFLSLWAMQMVIGNFLDPLIMGDRLRLNTITVIFGMVVWGVIWGIPGMFISVPLMVIIKTVMEKSETWSFIARAMTSSGKEKRTPKKNRPDHNKVAVQP
jgi:predicted PurR-regulated permease PerM